MKQILNFSLGDNGYRRTENTSDEMILLSVFLTTDYDVYGFPFLIEWANDPAQDGTNANITYLEKKGGKILVGDLFWEEGMPFIHFEFLAGDFIKFLNKWKQITKQGSKKIIITKEGDEITIKSKN